MTKALADMITELQEDVPAVDGVPSDAQYERAIKDAVREFSRRCGLIKNGTLEIISGTASYSLPADFLSMIEIDNPYSPEHQVIVTQSGIIPFSELNPFEEEYTIQNGTITFFPTPGYTMSRYFEYKAAWVLDVDDNYPLTEEEAQIVMLKAKNIAFEKLSNASAGAGFKYSVGNMSVDKSGVADGYSKRLVELNDDFISACNQYNGAVMR
jgi:hypothetical protein